MQVKILRTRCVLIGLVLGVLLRSVQAQLDLQNFDRPYNIHEDNLVETAIARVPCTNPGDACLCNLQSSNPPGPFIVWRKDNFQDFYVYYTGVANGQHLSFRNNPTYLLTITCTDTTRTESNTTVLEIDVQQNQAPQFTNKNYPNEFLTLDAMKPIEANTIIYNVTATDAEKDPLTFSFTTIPAVNYFTIGPADGIIKTTRDFRTVTEDHIIMTVSVTDGVNVINNFHIDLTILNLNTRPQIIPLPQTVYLLETVPMNTVVTVLSCVDPDPFVSQLFPSCRVNPDAEQYRFTFSNGTGRVTLTNLPGVAYPLDYERTIWYIINCTCNDGFLSSQNGILTVKVENVNEPPIFDETAYYCDLYESDAAVSTCDINAVITDPENDPIPIVGFLSGNNSDRFRYDRSTSQITFTVDYDVDQNLMPTSVILQLQATDVNGASSRVPVYIRVRDVNDNTCSFGTSALNTFRANQDTPLGIIGTVFATDNDLTSPNHDISFQVIQALPADATNYIAAYPDGSWAYTGKIPLENTGRSYSLILRAKDGGTPQRTCDGTVVLTFEVYTTTTSTTTTTTTPTTTTSTTTTTTTPTTIPTTAAPATSIWDNEAFVAIFAILMTLLILGLLVGLYFLLRFCGMFGGLGSLASVAPAVVEGEELAEEAVAPATRGLCGSCGGFDDFCCPKPPPPKKDNYFNMDVRTNNDFRDAYWKLGDNYESGKNYNPEGDQYGKDTGFGPRRLALPAPIASLRY